MVSKFIFRSFSGKVNYYEVLGVLPSAKPEEVKFAYRKLVKELHPDVTGNTSQEKFRLVTEAYTILSKKETRATYDLTQGSKEEVEAILSRKRDKDGLDVAKVKYAPHQYGYKRMKELAEERKAYNLDNFYRYKGGLPQKHLGSVRGEGFGEPGIKADAADLSFVLRGHNQIARESDYVDDVEAHEFKLSRSIDSENLIKNKPYLRAEIDFNFTKFQTFRTHLTFYLSVLGLLVVGKIISDTPKYRIQMLVHELEEKARSSHSTYEKAGLKAVSLR